MAVTLRCLGQAAAKQSVMLPLAAASPKILGMMSPQASMTPGAKTPSFFVDREALTPAASPFARMAHFHMDSERTPARRMAGSSGARFGMAPPGPSGYPVMLGRRSAFGQERSQEGASLSAGVEAQASSAASAREAFLARRVQKAERSSASAQASGAQISPVKAALEPPHPALLGHARRARKQAASPEVAQPAPEDPAACAREAFLARRARLEQRGALASEPALPTLLGRAREAGQQMDVLLGDSAEQDPAASAREAFVARRERRASREVLMAAAEETMCDLTPPPSFLPTLLACVRHEASHAAQATTSAVDGEGLARNAWDFFLAKRRMAASRQTQEFVV